MRIVLYGDYDCETVMDIMQDVGTGVLAGKSELHLVSLIDVLELFWLEKNGEILDGKQRVESLPAFIKQIVFLDQNDTWFIGLNTIFQLISDEISPFNSTAQSELVERGTKCHCSHFGECGTSSAFGTHEKSVESFELQDSTDSGETIYGLFEEHNIELLTDHLGKV
jgi:hypothetical protein